MKTLGDLLEHQLKDLFTAEDQLFHTLPNMIEKAKNTELKKVFEDHLKETKIHRDRIKEICDELKINSKLEKCLSLEILIKQANHFMGEKMEQEVMNAGLIARAHKIQHYKIASYYVATQFAKEMEYDDIASILQKTLEEEYAADKKIITLAEKRLNRQTRE